MKTILFNILFANLLTLGTAHATHLPGEPPKGDTIVIKMKNKNKVIVVTEKGKDLGSFKTIDINKIVADLDSTFKQDSMGTFSERIILKDSTMRIHRYEFSRGPRKSFNITVDSWSTDDSTHRYYSRDFKRKIRGRKNRPGDQFELDLGWNNYLENGKIPADDNKPYGIEPIWSNYVALRWQRFFYWQKEGTRWSNSLGVEVAWNNFKYDNAVIITKGSEGVSFDPFPADQKKIKSKLTATWLNLPLMIHYKSQKSSFHVALGGFVGYRLESHSKTKYEMDGSTKKDHVYTNFYLNSLQYGARFQLGYYGVDFFAQYNLNPLFSKGKGPELTPFSFGFTI